MSGYRSLAPGDESMLQQRGFTPEQLRLVDKLIWNAFHNGMNQGYDQARDEYYKLLDDQEQVALTF
jgi:acyl-CoA-binding protein